MRLSDELWLAQKHWKSATRTRVNSRPDSHRNIWNIFLRFMNEQCVIAVEWALTNFLSFTNTISHTKSHSREELGTRHVQHLKFSCFYQKIAYEFLIFYFLSALHIAALWVPMSSSVPSVQRLLSPIIVLIITLTEFIGTYLNKRFVLYVGWMFFTWMNTWEYITEVKGTKNSVLTVITPHINSKISRSISRQEWNFFQKSLFSKIENSFFAPKTLVAYFGLFWFLTKKVIQIFQNINWLET